METEDMTPHRPPLRLPVAQTLACACILVLAGLSAAPAQFLPGPGQSTPASQFPPVSGQSSPFPPPPGQSGPQGGRAAGFPPPARQSVCETFPAIRSEVEKGGQAIQAAGQRKASREEVCPLFKHYVNTEAKMIKFLVSNQTACGVPADAIKAAKASHAKAVQIRNNVCSAGPAAPTGPTLSDALGGPIIADDTSAKQPGRGTFDTLTGNVLSR
jgi:hypothetical protein